MTFDSYEYIFVFLPLVFVLYQCVRNSLLHNWLLVAASLFFYGWGNPYLILLLLFVSSQDYIIGKMIANSSNQRWHTALIVFSVATNLLLLSLFKYGDWLIDAWNGFNEAELMPLFHLDLPLAKMNLPLPIGVSFYTFHTISYTVDIYRRRMVPKTSFIDYLSFVSFSHCWSPDLFNGHRISCRRLPDCDRA